MNSYFSFFDWVPIKLYVPTFYTVLLFFVFVTMGRYITTNNTRSLIYYNNKAISFLTLFVIVWMGCRPLHRIFVDMTTYWYEFTNYSISDSFRDESDLVFWGGTYILSKLISSELYFFCCTLLYIMPIFIACKRIFKQYAYIGFLFSIVSFSFWAYGVNGIRNGIAGSFFILAFSYLDNKIIASVLFFLAVNFHKSELLPVGALILASVYNRPRLYIYCWLCCIMLSLIAGGLFESIFSSLGLVDDDRLASYLTPENQDTAYVVNRFRWDFLLYGAWPIAVGYYFIFRRKFRDNYYYTLFNTYVIANSFWVLVMRASFSNRFAYLSWFMMSFVIIYPFLKQRFWRNQPTYIAYMLLAYFSFTYLMNVILS